SAAEGEIPQECAADYFADYGRRVSGDPANGGNCANARDSAAVARTIEEFKSSTVKKTENRITAERGDAMGNSLRAGVRWGTPVCGGFLFWFPGAGPAPHV